MLNDLKWIETDKCSIKTMFEILDDYNIHKEIDEKEITKKIEGY